MDCGLSFPKNWLQSQLMALQNDDVDWVSGVCLTTGTTLVDKAAIAHTYGYLSARPVIPGSVVRRRVFDRIGLFKDLRAGYDVEWARSSMRAGLRRQINDRVVVKYHDVNFAPGLSGVFLKSLRYARPSVGRDDAVTPYVYVMAGLLGICTVIATLMDVLPMALLPFGFAAYLLGRLVIAAKKSRGFIFFLRSPFRLLTVLVVGLIMDFGKTCGFSAGIYTRFLRRRRLIR